MRLLIEIPLASSRGPGFAGSALINPLNICSAVPQHDGDETRTQCAIALTNGQTLSTSLRLEQLAELITEAAEG